MPSACWLFDVFPVKCRTQVRVAWSVGLSVGLSPSESSKKRLKRSRCRLRWGLGWAQGTTYEIQPSAFSRTLYCGHSVQYSHLVTICFWLSRDVEFNSYVLTSWRRHDRRTRRSKCRVRSVHVVENGTKCRPRTCCWPPAGCRTSASENSTLRSLATTVNKSHHPRDHHHHHHHHHHVRLLVCKTYCNKLYNYTHE